MAEAEVKKQTRRTRKQKQEVAPEAASTASGGAKPKATPKEAGAEITKLDNGLVIVSR